MGRRPQLLCLSGHDPTGGAGIQADIEACAALGVHALTIVTAHTVQDTQDVGRVSAVAPILLAAQLEALLADCAPAAAKIGLLGDPEQVPVLAKPLRALSVPIVIDPVLRAGGGRNLASAALRAAMLEELFPLAEIITPNAQEARLLAACEELDQCGEILRRMGAKHVLITGGDEPGDQVRDVLFGPGGEKRVFTGPRVAGKFHGAGCTLAATIGALRALGRPVADAVESAREHTAAALRRAFAAGAGRLIPGRSDRP